MTSTGISIVVPVYNSTQTLRELVARIENSVATTHSCEVILVDDGSTSETWKVIQELCDLSLIHISEPTRPY